MEWYLYAAVIAVGIIAGFINTLAGSGSLLTLPLLIFLGLPANIANGTNRVGILFQNIVGVSEFKRKKVFEFSEGIWLTVPAIIGSVFGALMAVNINERVMELAISGLLFFMFFVVLYKPEQWLKVNAGKIESKPKFVTIIAFFFIGIYGGFIQAGVGFFLLAGLVLGAGADLVKANALKLFITLAFTVFALAIFVWNKQVNWELGLTLAVGNMIGAFLGTRVAVGWGPKVIRYILLIVIFFSSLKISGAIDFLINAVR